jgi:hypothetical protein
VGHRACSATAFVFAFASASRDLSHGFSRGIRAYNDVGFSPGLLPLFFLFVIPKRSARNLLLLGKGMASAVPLMLVGGSGFSR